jgi:hypothetical protein
VQGACANSAGETAIGDLESADTPLPRTSGLTSLSDGGMSADEDWLCVSKAGLAKVEAASAGSRTPSDGADQPEGWRWMVLRDLRKLWEDVRGDYDRAAKRTKRQAWESRFGGPIATGGSAGVGAVVTVLGTSLFDTNRLAGIVVAAAGFLFALIGSVLSASNYVSNRSKQLRCSRLMHDIANYSYMLLPSGTASEAFAQLDNFRVLWETAGTQSS